ncbi:MAG: permease [Candidatus Margulisiibacteriota bacterium]
MKINKTYLFDTIIIVLFAIFCIFSFSINYQPGIEIARDNFGAFTREMLAFLPLMFVMIGLFDVWFPRENIERHIGKGSGIKGTFWVIILANLQAGPLYGAFPVACLLWKKGASIRNVFIYLGAFSAFKIPMLTFEIGFLGLKFSLLRTLFTIPAFILIAIVMEKYLQNKYFEIKEL